MRRRVEAREGVLWIDGEPQLLLIADYPYYRDDARNWEDRLRAQAEARFAVTSCYVPWRHHAPTRGAFDFRGATQANRNLVRFLDLADENGLRVFLKPGPFVHGELAYGGLPDYVEPGKGNAIEPERDADGHPLRWPKGEGGRALPAPFDPEYCAFVHEWLQALARDVLAGRSYPEGPVVGLQLLNEGVYSDSSDATPRQLGYSGSTLERYRAFLRERRGREAIEPPRRVGLLRAPEDILPYLDWSAFQATLYDEVARTYARFLHDAGLPKDFPIVFNFNPNINTYRTQPASNDGWYTRVNLNETEFTFGSTNWVGVVAGDPQAFRQYVMAMTAFRGPCMEQNWGFSSQYYAPYEYVTPSHFESMLALACGATGIAAYPLAATRAWRDDPSLGSFGTPERTNGREDETSGDYPGDAAILSNGKRTPKYWTLAQMAQYLRSEGPRFVERGPDAPIAWGVYAPYAWSGQWLPRGDPDDILWRPPLKAIPRGAYHGLDAFVEMMTRAGLPFRQVELTRDTRTLDRTKVLAISAHEFMDREAQERLAGWVERGGRLLLTNLVPDRDERLREAKGALATRVFPHETLARLPLREPEPVRLLGREEGRALEFAFHVRPPPDADAILHLGDKCVGYQRTVGEGKVIYAGLGPWRAEHSGDDRKLARANQELTWKLLGLLGAHEVSALLPVTQHDGEVSLWSHGDPARDEQHVFVVVREASGDIRLRVRRPKAASADVWLRSPSQSVHAFSLQDGHLRACYLKGTNDARGERVQPLIATSAEEWNAEDACDLCITPGAVSVAHLKRRRTTVVHGLAQAGGVEVEDVKHGGIRRRAREAAKRARPAGAARREG